MTGRARLVLTASTAVLLFFGGFFFSSGVASRNWSSRRMVVARDVPVVPPRREKRKVEATEAVGALTEELVNHLNLGVAHAYLNQKKIDAEAKLLHQNATNFARQAQNWLKLIEGLSSSLKDIGDVENWAMTMERELKGVTSALEYVYKGRFILEKENENPDHFAIIVIMDVPLDSEGEETLHRLIQLFLAAGYFRARITALYGKQMQCPHRIEPHQIQGMDLDKLFPVVQWLVKRAIERRKQMEDANRSFALYLANKNRPKSKEFKLEKSTNDEDRWAAILASTAPKRQFRHRDFAQLLALPPLKSAETTLMEYGVFQPRVSENDPLGAEASSSAFYEGERLSQMDNIDVDSINDQTPSLAKLTSMERLRPTPHPRAAKTPAHSLSREIELVEKKLDQMVQRKQELKARQMELKREFENLSEEVEDKQKKVARVEETLKDPTQKSYVASLQSVLQAEAALRAQYEAWLEQRAEESEKIRMFEERGVVTFREENDEDVKERLAQLRTELSSVAKRVAALTRELDDVPGRAELAQYQARFQELADLVIRKHLETKSLYETYNYLSDTKEYTLKQISLLNSVTDTFQSIADLESVDEKESRVQDFLLQFQKVVHGGLEKNERILSGQVNLVRQKREELQNQLKMLYEMDRMYHRTAKEFKEEMSRNDQLLHALAEGKMPAA
ncbi:unnamed protein product [Cyprideis torosa]|uniref:Coiled-coil domain-containing protein 93 n=1 Tax=Cyprideis torosa TaxID=163714 RepID=A0A7R8ZJI6_9CRUS|nr:unnamed protein product [Cyprideis torosa]CAG0887047.1 unnamed protein product [Cyprideis torosa]